MITLRHGAPPGSRFSPIASLDPISASLVSAIGCASALTIRSTSTRATVLRACICFTLAGSTMLNGAREYIHGVDHRRSVLAASRATSGNDRGGTRGCARAGNRQQAGTRSQPTVAEHKVDFEYFYSARVAFYGPPQVSAEANPGPRNRHPSGRHTGGGRNGRARTARLSPQRRGGSSLLTRRGREGILFALLLGLPAVSLWRDRASLTQPMPQFAFVLLVFAFAESNFSGELGTDGILWSLAGLVVLGLDDQFL